jgi:aspartyl-tRNA(Asn)/glutamyl-tRNA(Gln) amidotransferase subunit C
MRIDDETIDYLSSLSKLDLSISEREDRKNDLKEALDYIEKLNELNTDNVLESSRPFSVVNNFREDLPRKEFDKEVFLKNAPRKKDNYFKVIKILDEQ